ncbi:methyltransferase domain-containing protein [Oligoflexus sp.]|uniref:methyltransferase domain-containing protein n=1 Tax=Oligoflexus sp. TaxID=1971216 RepID=UPI0032C22BD4
MSDESYLHGYTTVEQERLRHQARFTEQSIYRNIDLTGVDRLLEVGVGVGAQSEIILRRYPEIKIVGIDQNEAQLASAQRSLDAIPWAKGRYELQKMDATSMDFESHTFDGAFICWVLEHVPTPERVLSEVRRVLKKGSRIFVTEVMNHSFFLEPYSPNVWKYWMAMNDFQHEQTGDPFIGAKLGNLLLAQGFTDIDTKVHTWHFDNRNPDKRKLYIEFWTTLLLSAKDQLLNAKVIDEETLQQAQKELRQVAKDPNAVFYFSFMQAQAVR